MDYGELLGRSWKLVRDNKFLILLGIVGAMLAGNTGFQGDRFSPRILMIGFEQAHDPVVEEALPQTQYSEELDIPWLFEVSQVVQSFLYRVPPIFSVVGVKSVIDLFLWFIPPLLQGALIHGVGVLDAGGRVTLKRILSAAWARKWTLFALNLIPAVPSLVVSGLFGIIALVSLGPDGRPVNDLVRSFSSDYPIDLYSTYVHLFMTTPLFAIGALAKRACLLEDRRIIDSLRRAWDVLFANLGPALILLIIQFGVMALVYVIPWMAVYYCLAFVAFVGIISGVVTTYVGTLWTLAWLEWTRPVPGDIWL